MRRAMLAPMLIALAACEVSGPIGPTPTPPSPVPPQADIMSPGDPGLVYYGLLQPVMAQACGSCHHAEGFAPPTLDTYVAVRNRVSAVIDALQNKHLRSFAGASEVCATPTPRQEDELAWMIDIWRQNGAPSGQPPANIETSPLQATRSDLPAPSVELSVVTWTPTADGGFCGLLAPLAAPLAAGRLDLAADSPLGLAEWRLVAPGSAWESACGPAPPPNTLTLSLWRANDPPWTLPEDVAATLTTDARQVIYLPAKRWLDGAPTNLRALLWERAAPSHRIVGRSVYHRPDANELPLSAPAIDVVAVYHHGFAREVAMGVGDSTLCLSARDVAPTWPARQVSTAPFRIPADSHLRIHCSAEQPCGVTVLWTEAIAE